MSASPLFRQILGSHPSPPVASPKPSGVLNMSDIHVIAPPKNSSENSQKAQRATQLLQAFQRFLAKTSPGQSHGSARKNASATTPVAASGFASGVQSQSADACIPPPLPTPSLPRIGVIKLSDVPRIRTPQACERCRERKTKCSGTRPTCKRCFHTGAECTYVLEHKANRAQLRKLREASGLFPKGLRPTRKEGSAQRKPSPSRLDPFFKLWKSGSSSPANGLPSSQSFLAPAQMGAPATSDSSFEFLDLSPPKASTASSPLANMSWTAPDESFFLQSQEALQPAPSAMNASLSYMDMDSEVNAAVAFMMANESLPEAQSSAPGWENGFNSTLLPPPTMPMLTAESQSGSGFSTVSSQSSAGYTPLPTPMDEDILMMDAFGPSVSAPAIAEDVGLTASDSELERELQSCMAEMLGDSTKEDGTVAFGLDLSRPIKPLPVRSVQAPKFPPPMVALPGRSFPPVSSDGAFFDEHAFDAFRPASIPKIEEVKAVQVETPVAAAVAKTTEVESGKEKEQSFDEMFGLKGGHLVEPTTTPATKLATIEEEPEFINDPEAVEFYTNLPTLWEELFGDKPSKFTPKLQRQSPRYRSKVPWDPAWLENRV